MGKYNWVYVGIRNFARETYGNSYVYDFETAISSAPVATDGSTQKIAAAAGTLSVSGSDHVLELANYAFGFTTTVDLDGTDYSDFTCTDFLVIDFGSGGHFSRTNDDYSGVTINNLGTVHVLPQTQKVVISFATGLAAGAKTLNLNNLVKIKFSKRKACVLGINFIKTIEITNLAY